MTPAEQDAQNKATAAAFNAQNPASAGNEHEDAMRAAAAAHNTQGNENHAGEKETRPNTDEENAAIEAKKAAEAEEAEKKAAEEAEAAKTPEQKAEEAEAAEALRKQIAEETNAAGWMETDDPTLQASLNLMKASGLSPAEAGEFFNDALATGNLDTVDRDALAARVGKDNAELIMSGVTKYSTEQGEETLAKINNVYNEVGGEKNWGKMIKWAKGAARADDGVKAEIMELQEMVNGSETQGKLAAQRLMQMYHADSKNSTLHIPKTAATTLTPTDTAPAVPPVEPITAQQYAEAIQGLKTRGAAHAADMKRLSAQRAAGRKAGI